jgi:hypothetical protein
LSNKGGRADPIFVDPFRSIGRGRMLCGSSLGVHSDEKSERQGEAFRDLPNKAGYIYVAQAQRIIFSLLVISSVSNRTISLASACEASSNAKVMLLLEATSCIWDDCRLLSSSEAGKHDVLLSALQTQRA